MKLKITAENAFNRDRFGFKGSNQNLINNSWAWDLQITLSANLCAPYMCTGYEPAIVIIGRIYIYICIYIYLSKKLSVRQYET